MVRSPFPGMGTYLEAPTIWPDVDTSLMSIFREQLTPLLAPKYLAELETQVVIDRVDDDILQVVRPDVSLTTPQGPAWAACRGRGRASAGAATGAARRPDSPGVDVHPPARERDTGSGDRTVVAGQ